MLPDYLSKQWMLRSKGVEEVVVFCVNDAHVMTAWGREQGTGNSKISLMADPAAKLTRALGMVLDNAELMVASHLGQPRCKRFGMVIDDGVIIAVNVSGTPDDPAGDEDPSAILVEAMLEACDKAAPAVA